MNEQALYIQSDIPPGMTCAEYRRRRLRTAPERVRRGRLSRLLRRPH